jgi:hypothetical protein
MVVYVYVCVGVGVGVDRVNYLPLSHVSAEVSMHIPIRICMHVSLCTANKLPSDPGRSSKGCTSKHSSTSFRKVISRVETYTPIMHAPQFPLCL